MTAEMANFIRDALGNAAIGAALVAGGIVGVMLAYDLGKPLWSRLVRLWRRSRAKCVAALAVLGFVVAWGGSKPKITFEGSKAEDEGLFDSGSYCTNNLLVAKWTYRGIPSSAAVYIDRRDFGSTDEWTNVGETTAGALTYTYDAGANATNWEYYVWYYYEIPVPVHTNGVWVGRAYRTRGGQGFVTVNTKITADGGRVIATPEKVVKKEEADEE